MSFIGFFNKSTPEVKPVSVPKLSLVDDTPVTRKNNLKSPNYRRYSIAIPEGSKIDFSAVDNWESLTLEQNKIIRASLLIIRAYDEKVAETTRIYLKDLMSNTNNYTNVLSDFFFSFVEKYFEHFHQNIKVSLERLSEIRELLQKPDLMPLDREYLIHKEYLPLRASIENEYRERLQSFGTQSDIVILGSSVVLEESFLIWEGQKSIKSSHELIKVVKKRLFRHLVKKYEGQLTILEPYAVKFKDQKHPRKVLEEIYHSLTDYQILEKGYRFSGGQTYLSSFCASIEKLLRETIPKIPQDTKDLTNKRLKLTNALGNLFVQLLTVEEMAQKFVKLYATDKLTLPKIKWDANTFLFDPGIYFHYCHSTLKDIEKKLDFDLVIVQKSDEITSYLKYAESYRTSCQKICELIEEIIPWLVVETKDSKIINMTPGSSARRKLTTPDSYIQIPIALENIYNNLSSTKNVYLSQKKALDFILDMASP